MYMEGPLRGQGAQSSYHMGYQRVQAIKCLTTKIVTAHIMEQQIVPATKY